VASKRTVVQKTQPTHFRIEQIIDRKKSLFDGTLQHFGHRHGMKNNARRVIGDVKSQAYHAFRYVIAEARSHGDELRTAIPIGCFIDFDRSG
jgi:hypothetical protein